MCGDLGLKKPFYIIIPVKRSSGFYQLPRGQLLVVPRRRPMQLRRVANSWLAVAKQGGRRREHLLHRADLPALGGVEPGLAHLAVDHLVELERARKWSVRTR